jgi:hypothetical protein
MALPGFVTLDQESLLSSVEAVLAAPSSWMPTPEDERFMQQMWGRYDGRAAQLITRSLESGVSDPLRASPAR